MPLNHHFEPKKNAIFDRHKFRQNIERTNESSINFATRLCKLASTFELKYQNPTLVIRQSEEMQAGIARHKINMIFLLLSAAFAMGVQLTLPTNAI